jgi:hypothetical protein
MHYDTDRLREQIAARREAKQRLFVRRVVFVGLMTLFALALLYFWPPRALGADLTFSFHRQPDEEKHTPWYLCVENLSPEPARVRLADIYRAAGGNVALYDPGKLSNVMRHKPRAKWLRALGIAGAAASIVIPLAGVKEIGVNLIGPALSGGTAIAVPAIEANQRFEVGIEGYWTTDHLLDAREARCSRVMSARSKDTLATFTFESRDVRAEMFHEAQHEQDELIPFSSLKVEHGGAYTLPGDCVSCQTDTAMLQPPCRPSAVVEEDGVEPCAWVD